MRHNFDNQLDARGLPRALEIPMPLLTTYRSYPQLFLCSVLLLILGFLGAGLYLHNTYYNQQEQIQNYGQTLARSAARQAVDATLTQDLISLQAVLLDVGQAPKVVGAAIHNVENKLLVQSGYNPNQPMQGERYSFTAPIALHNNIAGYLQVTLEVPRYSRYDYYFLMIWTIAVFVALWAIWWSIQRQWWSRLRDKLPSPGKVVSTVVEKIPTIPEVPLEALKPLAPEPPPPPEVAVRLQIRITNLTKLYQQLNSEGFANVLRRFEKQLQGVLSLYNGQRQLLNHDTLMVEFVGEALYDCSFRALCCAQLLSNLCARANSPRLQLSAAIQEVARPANHAGCALLKDFVAQQQDPIQPERGDILISRHLLSDTLLNHIEVDENSGKLAAIKAPYSELLARQEEQLVKA